VTDLEVKRGEVTGKKANAAAPDPRKDVDHLETTYDYSKRTSPTEPAGKGGNMNNGRQAPHGTLKRNHAGAARQSAGTPGSETKKRNRGHLLYSCDIAREREKNGKRPGGGGGKSRSGRERNEKSRRRGTTRGNCPRGPILH